MVFKMRSCIFILFIAAVAAYEPKGTVSFSGTRIIFSCASDSYLQGGSFIDSDNPEYDSGKKEEQQRYCEKELEEDNGNRKTVTTLKFYIHAKVCENCYDMDAALVVGAIAADLLLTGGVIIITYTCGRKKSGSPPQKSVANPRRGANPSAPPVPSPDYQPLSDFTRSKDTYATVHKTQG